MDRLVRQHMDPEQCQERHFYKGASFAPFCMRTSLTISLCQNGFNRRHQVIAAFLCSEIVIFAHQAHAAGKTRMLWHDMAGARRPMDGVGDWCIIIRCP